MTTPEEDEVASALILKSVCTFTSQKCLFIPRIVLFVSRIALLFSRIVLLFPGIALLFSRTAFFVLKNALPLVFQKCLLLIYCAHLFPWALFFRLIVPSSRPAQSYNCFALVLFPLGTIYWPPESYVLTTLCLASYLSSYSSNKQSPAPVDIIVPSWFFVSK